MNVARPRTTEATPYRGIFRVLIVYCAGFFLAWVIMWLPSHSNVVGKCNDSVIDESYYKQQPRKPYDSDEERRSGLLLDNELMLYMQCHPPDWLDVQEEPNACALLRNYEIRELQFTRAPSREEIYKCYSSEIFGLLAIPSG